MIFQENVLMFPGHYEVYYSSHNDNVRNNLLIIT